MPISYAESSAMHKVTLGEEQGRCIGEIGEMYRVVGEMGELSLAVYEMGCRKWRCLPRMRIEAVSLLCAYGAYVTFCL